MVRSLSREEREREERKREEWCSRSWRKYEMYVCRLSVEEVRQKHQREEQDLEEWKEWERQEQERKKRDEVWHRAWGENWHGHEYEQPAISLKRRRPGFDDFE